MKQTRNISFRMMFGLEFRTCLDQHIWVMYFAYKGSMVEKMLLENFSRSGKCGVDIVSGDQHLILALGWHSQVVFLNLLRFLGNSSRASENMEQTLYMSLKWQTLNIYLDLQQGRAGNSAQRDNMVNIYVKIPWEVYIYTLYTDSYD